MTPFKKANRVGEPNLFSAELLAELGTSFEYCTDLVAVCQVVQIVLVELPSIKNAMIRKREAAEFIGSHSMEVRGDSLTKRLMRLMGFKNGQSGVVPMQDCEEGAPVAKSAKVEEGT